MVFAMAAPLFAQIMMIVVMIVQGQWMFAMMVVPGAIGCLASVLIALPWGSQAAAEATPSASSTASSRPITVDDDTGDAVAFHTMASQSIEAMLGFDRLPWRTIVGHWIGPADLNVPLGTGAQGRFDLDLVRQGPHALVAGTTGSGKSVLLQSWCLALAACNGPDRLNFVFLDFKGGSAFRALEQLPHTVGNVCDLDLAHAARALRALEAELTRRERLAAEHHAAHIEDMPLPPPRLMVVIDEFHALKDQLPDYIGRLVRIASLGRSLGMHLIACTQNPLGQVNADMKANMAINICLRVRDTMQSTELLGDGRAASIPPALPGSAYCNDGEQVTALRCAPVENIARCCRQVTLAHRFMGFAPTPPLFTAPLPTQVPAPIRAGHARNRFPDRLWFGLADDGIALHDATVPITTGNIGVIGAHGRGKTTVLTMLARSAAGMDGLMVRYSRVQRGERTAELLRGGEGSGARTTTETPDVPHPPRLVWVVDDADELFDPFNVSDEADEFRKALADTAVTVVFAVTTARHVRVPEHCVTRIAFPCGERTADLMTGIPSNLLATLSQRDLDTPGRAVLVAGATACLVQCAA
ncbi:cell division protein FtsK [Bifidobacterium callitrichidarum]|uniref:Cell division protein FtsK n=2 Tax=Bifidobacterium callitrichidarum TaxID=2052941 RepID=A0A2U2N8G4_9BIFI|nr:FtsK/SpoIIIE domain-containing protein [Bifidobacterium callitrichidarum]PWG65362.1 cell division protein FtsK [Bifidobacterium callitrichidarum]